MFKRYGVLLVVIALAVVFATPAALAGAKGTNRPFKGSAVGIAQYGGEGNHDGLTNVRDCDEAAGTEYAEFFQVTTFTSAHGTASHLGKIRLEAVHCPGLVGPVDGQLALVAANGDVLYGEYQGVGETAAGDLLIDIDFKPKNTLGNCDLLHGVACESTGRFAKVTGTATWTANAMPTDENDPFVPWSWWGDWKGSLSY